MTDRAMHWHTETTTVACGKSATVIATEWQKTMTKTVTPTVTSTVASCIHNHHHEHTNDLRKSLLDPHFSSWVRAVEASIFGDGGSNTLTSSQETKTTTETISHTMTKTDPTVTVTAPGAEFSHNSTSAPRNFDDVSGATVAFLESLTALIVRDLYESAHSKPY